MVMMMEIPTKKCKKCGKDMPGEKYKDEAGHIGFVWKCDCGYICGEIPLNWDGREV